MDRKLDLQFEKYVCPLGRNLKDFEFPGAFNDIDEELLDSPLNNSGGMPIAVTTHGLIPLTEHNDPTKVFDLWVGHANFDLTRSTLEVIENVEGVEILVPFSRYRFLIGFGKLFKSSEVKVNIRKALGITNHELQDILKNKVDLIREQIVAPYWGIFLLPNGKIDYIQRSENDEVFQNQIALYEQVKEYVGGYLLTYKHEQT